MNSTTYVNCPVCGVPDCRREVDEAGFALIFCTNHACKSNGGSYVEVPDKNSLANRVNKIRFDLMKASEELDALNQNTRHLGSYALVGACDCLQAALRTASTCATNVLGHIKR